MFTGMFNGLFIALGIWDQIGVGIWDQIGVGVSSQFGLWCHIGIMNNAFGML